MSIPVQFSERDLARGTLVTPAWYRLKVDSISPKPSKDGGSTNYVVEGTVIHNADDGSTDFAGAIIVWNFNSKAPGFMQGYFKAFMGPDAKLTPGERYDLESTVGRELEVFIENDTWNGNVINRVNHKYRAVRES